MRNEFSDAELEARLTEVLGKLPDAPVPSNFTARVMQAVDREEAGSQRRWKFIWNWHAWVPRVAFAAVAVIFAGLTLHQHETVTQRHAMADSVAFVASQPLPSVDALKNFDAIKRMSQHADEELLALGPELQ